MAGHSGTFERYALGLARKDGLPPAGEARPERRAELLSELLRLGVRGWPERMTLYTRELPAGCVPCLEGLGSNLCLTTLCNRECFFCFNPKPRSEGMSVHGRQVPEEEVPEALEGFGVRSLGMSGGEPLLDPERVMRIARLVRSRFGRGMRIDLYTNGDLLTVTLARRLKTAGIDALRVNLAAGGYRTRPVELALTVFPEVEVEIPAVPGDLEKVAGLMDDLDRLGAGSLILHELFCSAQNVDALRRLGYESGGESGPRLTWSPVAGSEETALELMIRSLRRGHRLSVYYCSCGTQGWIAERALERRKVVPAAQA